LVVGAEAGLDVAGEGAGDGAFLRACAATVLDSMADQALEVTELRLRVGRVGRAERRWPAGMARVRVRPVCDRHAVARLTYDTIACQVWLDPVPELPGRAQEICELHASRLTVPRGWMLCDRRPEEPALFVHEAV